MPEITHKQFIRKYPELGSLPEFIIGVGDKQVRLMDAKLADLRHYSAFLTRRIQRRRRLMPMMKPRREEGEI